MSFPLDRNGLAALPPAARLEALTALLRDEVARAAQIPVAAVGADAPPAAAGIDSLAAVELKGRLEERLGLAVDLNELLDTGSLAELAAAWAPRLAATEPAREDANLAGESEIEFPLSAGQRALWFLHRLSPRSAAYNLAAAVQIAPPLDPGALARAFAALCTRHPALRTTFSVLDGEPRQRIHERLDGIWCEVAAERWSEAELAAWLDDEALRPFDLAAGPPVRATLLRRDGGAAVLQVVVHHLVADFGSLALAARELGIFYDREAAAPGSSAAALPPPGHGVADFVRWQREQLAGPAGERLWDFWRGQLEGAPPALDLSADRPRSPVDQVGGDRGGAVTRPLNRAAEAALRGLTGTTRSTLFAAALAAFAALLHRFTGQGDLVVGTPASGRTRPAWSDVFGYFVNPVPLRLQVAGARPFAALLAETRQTVGGALEHQDFPFPLLAERLQPERDPGRSPVFQVMFLLHRSPRPGLEALPGLALGWPGVPVSFGSLAGGSLAGVSLAREERTAQLDLALSLAEVDGALLASLRFDADLFDPATARRLLGSFEVLLAAAGADASRPVAELPLLTAAEARQVLVEWNDTGGAEPAGESENLFAAFAAQAAATPQAVALVCDGHHLSYGELERRAGRLSGRLRALGVAAEDRVGVLVDRSPEMVAALLGILANGGAYVALDPAYPRERLDWMLRDCAAAALCARRGLADLASCDLPMVDVDSPDGPTADALDVGAGLAPAREGASPSPTSAAVAVLVEVAGAGEAGAAPAGPWNLAYVLYTSGSTGRPKGVAIEHGSALALLRWARSAFPDRETDRVLATTSIGFDLSVFELFVPLTRGGTVVLARDLLAFPAREDVTLINTVPSLLSELLLQQELPPSVQAVNLAGEPLPRALVEAVARRAQRAAPPRVLNLYGPSEDTTYSTWEVVPPHETGAPAIGRPVAGSRAYVLDAGLALLPVGVPGQLHLAGAGLARGYWQRPQLTAARFGPDPFGGFGARLYATGDLARRRPDGRLDFLGRIDHQVKVRGVRIELGEIEALLTAVPALSEAVVAVRETAPGSPQLVAYVVPRLAPGPAAAELRSLLAARLPASMVPAIYVELPGLPRTATGKVDRRALPAPTAETSSAAVPRTLTEELLAGIWCEVLERERVGPDDDFFRLGGHSLLAVRIASRVHRAFGVELPVRTLFEAPRLGALAARIEELGRVGGATALPPLAPVPREGPLPLSFAQQRLWFLHQLAPDSPRYHLPGRLHLAGPLRPALLERSLAEVVCRHEALRTRFVESAGEPYQEVLPAPPLRLTLADLAALPAAAVQAEGDRLAQTEARRAFDLSGDLTGRDPLLRTLLLRSGVEEHVLLVTLHHIAGDGWSLGLLLDELDRCYGALLAGRAPALPPLPVQYPDFAVWQRAWLTGEALAEQLAHWRRELAGLEPLELPVDRPRPPAASARAVAASLVLPAAVAADLQQIARREGATFFMALLTGFQALLGRLTGQTDFAVGVPVAGRRRPEVEPLIGFFVNTLALRARLDGDPDLPALLGRVREATLEAHAHQDLPFERLVEALQPDRDLARPPLVQVLLALQNVPLGRRNLGDLTARPAAVDTAAADFDLSLLAAETDSGWELRLEAARDLFDPPTVRRLAGHLETLLAAWTAAPTERLTRVALLPAAERHQVLHEWHTPEPGPSDLWSAGPWPHGAAIPGLFAARAAGRPDAVALVQEGRHWSAGELAGRAAALAHRLRGLGVGPEVVVGLHADRCGEMVVGLLAILTAGGVCLQLDPELPAARLATLVRESGVGLTLVIPGREWDATPGLHLDLTADRSDRADRADPIADPEPAQTACLIYTSGSTGLPKGVAITYGALAAYLRGAVATYRLGPGDRSLQFSALSFDASLEEILAALLGGATLVLRDEAMTGSAGAFAAGCEREALTLLTLTPSHWHELVAWMDEADAELPPSVRLVSLGGEAPLLARWQSWQRRVGGRIALDNAYGPTEAVVAATRGWLDAGTAPAGLAGLSIGRPLPGVQIRLLDREGRPVPIGVPGELCVGGRQARGYWRRPELTAERFVPDPDGEPGGRLYRTGDLVRWLPDGRLDFLGRSDHQVKLRGFRIELGEIETALAALPDLREVAVAVREPNPGDRQLVAYVVPHHPPGPETAALRAHLASRLPGFMVPAFYVVLDALPRTVSDKIDRRALPTPEPGPPEPAVSPSPLAQDEELLADLWGEVLGRDGRFGPADDFFDLGGHSLLATRVLSRVRARFGVELPVRALFEAPTLAAFAARIAAARGGATTSLPPLPPIIPAERSAPLPLSFAQQRLWFLHQLAPDSPRYNMAGAVRLAGTLSPGRLRRALDGVVRRHEALRTRFVDRGGVPVQEIRPPFPRALPVADLGALPPVPLRAETLRLARAEAHRPVDLAGDVLRTTLLRQGPDEHVLLLTLHHIAGDGWSFGVLVREVGALYGADAAGAGAPLSPLPIQYADFALWQRAWLQGEALERELDVWRARLADLPVLELPADRRPRPALPGARGGAVAWRPAAGLAGALRRLARREGATLFMVALAGFQALLGRLSGQRDFAVGSPVAGRTRTEIEPLIGFFVNTLPLRARLDGDDGTDLDFRALVGRAREVTLEASAHQAVPFEKLVEELQPGRDLGHAPLVQVLLALENVPMPALALPGLALELLPVPQEATRFELAVALAEEDEGIAGTFTYARDLFDAATVARWADALERLLAAAAVEPETRLSDLPLLSPAARWQLLGEWNDGAAMEAAAGDTVHQLFERQARRTPDAVAVCTIGTPGGATLSYGGLDHRSGLLARRLRGLGVGPEVPVAVSAEPSPELLIALLGILRAGGAYLPLDPEDPAERLAWVLADARPPVLVVQRSLRDRLPDFAARPRPPVVLELEDLEDKGDLGTELDRAPAPAAPHHLAYVLYTSGSTGRPKGVPIEHHSLAAYLEWAERDLLAGLTVPLLARVSFDASLKQLFAPLLAGRAVHAVAPSTAREPVALLQALGEVAGELVLNCVPALWSALAGALERGEAPVPRIRRLLLGGDDLDQGLIARSLRLLPGIEIVNLYGPTEATANSTHAAVRRAGAVTLGRPAAGARLHVVDRDGGLSPLGAPGELWIGGRGLSRGYLGQPAQTAERFVPDPWSGRPGERLYRSGDLGQRLADGTLRFLGRIDRQVKIRGLRVELGEVEAALTAHPAVAEAAVLRDAAGSALIAWYAPAPGAAVRDDLRHDLRDFLRRRLPAAWVPAAFHPLAALPRLAAGKVDRRALATLVPASPEQTGPARQLSAMTEIVAGIWAELLRGEGRAGVVGPDDDFFALGGHSLLAAQVVSRLRLLLGVELPLRDLFEAPTPAALALRVEQARQAGAGPAAPPLAAGPRDGAAAPLSFAQRQLWLAHQLDPESPAYNLPIHLDLTGRLVPAALGRALAELARRHDILRTVFPGSEPEQRVGGDLASSLPLVDLTVLPAPRPEAGRLGDEAARRPFDLARGPLWRGILLRLAGDAHRLLLDLHHIVIDGWSVGILIREMAAFYQEAAGGPPAALPPLPLQYADFARWQRDWWSATALERELAWWSARLAGAPRAVALPADRPARSRPGTAGTVFQTRLPPLSGALEALGGRQGATRSMVLLAVFAALVQRLTGQDDFLVGSPVAARDRAETEGLIGFFVNLVVLRLRPDRHASAAALLRDVREAALDAYTHQDLPFSSLVEALAGERHHPLAPLVQVVFAHQEAPLRRLELPGLTFTPLVPDTGAAKFDLSWVLETGERGLNAALEYRRELFDAATVQRWSRTFAALLATFADAADAADRGTPLAELPLLDAAERAQLLVEWNDSAAAFQDAIPVHQLFARHAAADPAAPALVGGSASRWSRWTRGELAGRAGRLARRLLGLGLAPEAVVAVYLERSPELVAAFVAILQAGAAYLPIDSDYPPERVALLLADAAAPVVLTDRRLVATLPASGARVLLVDAEVDDRDRDVPAVPAWPDLLPDQLAYVIYTSGSTGRPKGVEISHRALANLAAWHRAAYALTPADRASLIAGVSFDASVWEIWPALTAGACLLVPDAETRLDPERLAGWLEAHAATHCFLPTPLAEALLAGGRPPGADLRFLLVGGERLRSFRPPGAGYALVNHYGPTESAVVASAGPVPVRRFGDNGALPSIGRPIANTELFVLDPALQPVPLGVAGEICIGGTGLARGYRAGPDLTAERFVPSPFGIGERLYRTGDLARQRPDGALDFRHRVDHQVKVRGHRIELAEIEAALAEHPLVLETVVALHEEGPGDGRLVAYVVPRDVGDVADAGDDLRALRSFLQGRLPGFMVPAHFVPLTALPLTPNGKVDRRALPPPDGLDEAPFVPPATPVEEVVAALWAQLLRRERVGRHDDFFALGGHSLLAIRVATRLRQVFKIDLPLKSLFQATTVAELAHRIEEHEATPGQSEKVARLVRQLQGMSAQEARDRLQETRTAALAEREVS